MLQPPSLTVVMLEGFASVVTLGMAKYRKLSPSIYYCVYHVVWTPKYGFRIMRDVLADMVEDRIRTICAWKEVEILELKCKGCSCAYSLLNTSQNKHV